MDNGRWLVLKVCAAGILIPAGMLSVSARAEQDVVAACERDQCLISDFIENRNVAAGSESQAAAAYGFPEDAMSGAGLSRDELCVHVPSTECFSRVVALRQKTYMASGRSEPIGCLVVGGIFRADGLYRSYGVVYEHVDARWRPVSISYYMSLNDVPSVTDLLTDPCPPHAGE